MDIILVDLGGKLHTDMYFLLAKNLITYLSNYKYLNIIIIYICKVVKSSTVITIVSMFVVELWNAFFLSLHNKLTLNFDKDGIKGTVLANKSTGASK